MSNYFGPGLHFDFWWKHILAREPDTELGDSDDPENLHGEKVIDQLYDLAINEKRIMLSVFDIRQFLKKIKRSDLNKNASLILKKLTGIPPPEISDDIKQQIKTLFLKVIDLTTCSVSQRQYYPYYIYKIIDSVIPESDTETRKILSYIHLQSETTLKIVDEQWLSICDYLFEFSYKPTVKQVVSWDLQIRSETFNTTSFTDTWCILM